MNITSGVTRPTKINTAYWAMDGIKVMSDKDFELILTAVMAQKNALQELNDGYGCF